MALVMLVIIAKNRGNQRDKQLMKRNVAKHKLLATDTCSPGYC